MSIPIKQPITVPTKTYDKYWCTRIEIMSAVPGGEIEARVSLTPYNDAGEYLKSQTTIMTVSNIMAKIQASPSGDLATAMTALLAAIATEKAAQDA